MSLLQESIEFRQTALETTLQLVYSIIWELKTHEIIENTVIMQVVLRNHLLSELETDFGYFFNILRVLCFWSCVGDFSGSVGLFKL